MKFALTINSTYYCGDQVMELDHSIILINLDEIKIIDIDSRTGRASLLLNSNERYFLSESETTTLLANMSDNKTVRNVDMSRVYKHLKKSSKE